MCFHSITHGLPYSFRLLSNSCLKAIIGVRPVILRGKLLSVFVLTRSEELLSVFVFTRSELDRKACKCMYESIFLSLLQSGNGQGLLSVCELLLLRVGLPTPEQIAKTRLSTGSDVLTEVPVPVHAGRMEARKDAAIR
jgi:hypothetical protein